jgi:D-alanyl-lipoteichoic acid acyltransferase DltB (MBOAT superfamily)
MIFLGLVQKVVLADTMAPIADAAYGIHGASDSFATLVGVYAFSLQIYFDFVGYSNIAIGSAGLLGVELPDNFRRPYIATCLSDFWKRWHLSLSTWLRDYLYIPLGGGRGTMSKICRNLMITMTLGGLWHGASWNFAIWGALNGLILCLDRVFGLEDKVNSLLDRHPNGFRFVWSLVTFNLFSLLWIPFRAHTFPEFLDVVSRLLAFSIPAAVTLQQIAVCVLALGTILVCLCDERLAIHDWASRLHPLVKAPVFAAMALAAFSFSSQGNQPFIYFRF